MKDSETPTVNQSTKRPRACSLEPLLFSIFRPSESIQLLSWSFHCSDGPPFWKLQVLRLPHKQEPRPSGDQARRKPFWKLQVLRLPHKQKPRPSGDQARRKPSGGSKYCACHTNLSRDSEYCAYHTDRSRECV